MDIVKSAGVVPPVHVGVVGERDRERHYVAGVACQRDDQRGLHREVADVRRARVADGCGLIGIIRLDAEHIAVFNGDARAVARFLRTVEGRPRTDGAFVSCDQREADVGFIMPVVVIVAVIPFCGKRRDVPGNIGAGGRAAGRFAVNDQGVVRCGVAVIDAVPRQGAGPILPKGNGRGVAVDGIAALFGAGQSVQIDIHRAAALIGILIKTEVCLGDLTACGQLREIVDVEIATDDFVAVSVVPDIQTGVRTGSAVRITGGNEGGADVVRIFRRLGHRGVEEDGICAACVVHPLCVGSDRQQPTAGGFFQLVSGIIRSLILGVHHVGRGDGVDFFAVGVGQGNAAVVQKLRRQAGDLQTEGVGIVVLPRGDDDAFLDAVGVVFVAKRCTVQQIFVFQCGIQFFRLCLREEGVRDFFLCGRGDGQNLSRNKRLVLGVNRNSSAERFRLLGFGCSCGNSRLGVFRNLLLTLKGGLILSLTSCHSYGLFGIGCGCIRIDCIRSLRVVFIFCIQCSICGIISSAHDLDRRLRLDRAFCIRG